MPDWKAAFHEVIFEADTPAGKAFDVWLLIAIVLSVTAVTLETVAPRGSVMDMAYDRDGRWLATASVDGVIRIWDAKSGRFGRALAGHDDLVASIAFSPCGRYLVSGSRDQTVRLWDIQSGPLRVMHSGF